jgi:SHS2 domain-containing protein
MPFRYLEDIALADVAFEAEAPTLPALFAEAWAAALAVMVDEPQLISPVVGRRVHLEATALDLLLFDFLGRLVYHKDADALLLRVEDVQVESAGETWQLDAALAGERIDPGRHALGVDIKAVTMHRLAVERVGDLWRAVVVLDV